MRYIPLLLLSVFLSSCSLLNSLTEVRLIPPEDFPHLAGRPESYRIVEIQLQNGRTREWIIPAEKEILLSVEKESLSCFLLYPGGWTVPFQPFPAAVFVDPNSGESFRFRWSCGPAGLLAGKLRASGQAEGFNFPRLALLSEERLGLLAWQADLQKWELRIREGRFSSIYIKPGKGDLYTLPLKAGRWISEDPGVSAFQLQEGNTLRLKLVPGQKLRLLELNSLSVVEVVCSPEGELLLFHR